MVHPAGIRISTVHDNHLEWLSVSTSTTIHATRVTDLSNAIIVSRAWTVAWKALHPCLERISRIGLFHAGRKQYRNRNGTQLRLVYEHQQSSVFQWRRLFCPASIQTVKEWLNNNLVI